MSLFSTLYAGESDWEHFLDVLVTGKELIFRQVSYPLSCWEKVIWDGFGHLEGWERLSSEHESFVHLFNFIDFSILIMDGRTDGPMH